MNSVKNLLVCVMLMGVSYGAYQVVSSPDPTLTDDQAVELDIQIGPRTDESPALSPTPPENLTTTDTEPLPSSPQSIPPLPKEFSNLENSNNLANGLTSTPPPIKPPPLKVPELTMPELTVEAPANSNTTGGEFVANSSTPPNDTLAPANNKSAGGFVPSTTAPPLAPAPEKSIDDPVAFSPMGNQSEIPLGSQSDSQKEFLSQPPTRTAKNNSGGSFDPTPETQLSPVTPKPSVNDLATNLRNQVNQAITNPYSDAANNVVQATQQAVQDAGQQITESLVEPSRAANEMLNPEKMGSRAKELIEGVREKTDEAIDALAEKANALVPTAPSSESPSPETTYATIDWQGLNELASTGQPEQALSRLTEFYSAELPQDQRLQMLEWLDLLAGKVIYSTENLLQDRPYVVRDGETLEDIANAWNVPAQLIFNVNQSKIGDPTMLVPGTELKMIPGPFNAVVSLERQELTLFLDGMYAGRFPIELGQDGDGIKHGSFIVEQKSPGREYVSDNGQKIAAATSDNPYGQYWIGLNENLAIHESNPTPGQQDNRGLIRLGSRDAADVFGILSSGSQVRIMR